MLDKRFRAAFTRNDFYRAEKRRAVEVAPLKSPPFKGTDPTRFAEHLRTAVAPWLEKKRAAIDSVATEYGKIVELRPAAPPSWTVAAAARVAVMWTDLADELGAVAIDVQKKDARTRAAFAAALAPLRDPVALRAKAAAKQCLDLAAKLSYEDERARACEIWLARTFTREFHVVDEILPKLSAGSPPTRPPPLLRDGSPFYAPFTQRDKSPPR